MSSGWLALMPMRDIVGPHHALYETATPARITRLMAIASYSLGAGRPVRAVDYRAWPSTATRDSAWGPGGLVGFHVTQLMPVRAIGVHHVEVNRGIHDEFAVR